MGCFALRKDPAHPHCCSLQWILNTNLHGWIPQYIKDPAFTNMMLEYVKHLRVHLVKLKENGMI